ncbi:hypothetical protein GG344DRAFT_72498 [Lentinula edodes]|nr:hypothetical protein GG344DRAFT_72498 [Lentinula edodes]
MQSSSAPLNDPDSTNKHAVNTPEWFESVLKSASSLSELRPLQLKYGLKMNQGKDVFSGDEQDIDAVAVGRKLSSVSGQPLAHARLDQFETPRLPSVGLPRLAFVFINAAALATGVTHMMYRILTDSRVAFSHDADDRQLINIQDSPDVSPASALTSDSPALTQKDALFSVPAYSWDVDQRVTRSPTTHSSMTIDSRTARSIREAVIHQARIGKPSVTDPRDSAMAQFPQRLIAATELAPPRTAVKSLRPKLVIVTKTFDPWSSRPVAQAEEDELSSVFEHRSFAAPSERILASRFSSPSLATTRSRSTITYPSQILSSSSASRSSEGLIMVDSASGSW